MTVTSVGTQGRNTTLSAAAAAGATNIKVASVTGMAAGDSIVVDGEAATIATVGTAGANGTGVTLASALNSAHASGAAVQDLGTGDLVHARAELRPRERAPASWTPGPGSRSARR